MDPDAWLLLQRLQPIMDLVNVVWPGRACPGVSPAAVEDGEEQPCMGRSRWVGSGLTLRCADRSGRGEHRRRKTQCEYCCANPPSDALHSEGMLVLLLAHVIRSLNSDRK